MESTENIPGNISLRDYMEKWNDTVQSINEIKSMLGTTHPCKQETKIGEFARVVEVEIPEMKDSIKSLDEKVETINDAVIIIKDKVINGYKMVAPWKIWSAIGGIFLTFGTIIVWILGQLK
jgi:hypothetical protein